MLNKINQFRHCWWIKCSYELIGHNHSIDDDDEHLEIATLGCQFFFWKCSKKNQRNLLSMKVVEITPFYFPFLFFVCFSPMVIHIQNFEWKSNRIFCRLCSDIFYPHSIGYLSPLDWPFFFFLFDSSLSLSSSLYIDRLNGQKLNEQIPFHPPATNRHDYYYYCPWWFQWTNYHHSRLELIAILVRDRHSENKKNLVTTYS